MKGKRGFSLLEILIALVVIGILTAIIVPNYLSYKLQAYNNNALYDLKNLIEDELSFFASTQQFVAFSVNNVTSNGIVKVGNFEHRYLSKDIRATAKVNGEYANFCTKHKWGDKIYGYESETDTFYCKQSQQGYELQDSDCPEATGNNDFTGWEVLAQSK